MYDMYPEWGPSRHRDHDDRSDHSVDDPFADRREGQDREVRSGVQAALDLRDNGGLRPDDN